MLFSFLLVLAVTPSFAQPAKAQSASVVITDGWFRSLPGKLPAGGYFTARNVSAKPVAIVHVEAGDCGSLMLHQSTNMGGMSSMGMVNQVAIPAGGEVKFAPGGYHLMCENPKLKIGGKEPVAFTLSDGSDVVVAFQVRNATGK